MISTNLPVGFAHRHNADGTFDSICYHCFMTVATEGSELELIKAELDHDCYDLAREKDCASRGRFVATGSPETRLDRKDCAAIFQGVHQVGRI